MRAASPLAQLQAPRMAFLDGDAEIMFLPGGGHIATKRIELADGSLEIAVESFDRNGISGGRQTAVIQGCRLAAAA
jgi:hypothetical protein